MPAAVPALFAAVGQAIATEFVMATFIKTFVVNLVLGSIAQSLQKKPTSGGIGGTSVAQRATAASHEIIYGRTRVGGTIIYMEATNNNKYLHVVVALSGHELAAVEAIYFDNTQLQVDGNGYVTTSPYTNKVRIQTKLGTADQTAFSDLVSASDGNWTANHRLRGRACVYLRLEYDQDVFPNGLPSMHFQVRGKKVYDPRSNSTIWSANPALCIADYLTNAKYGLGADYATEIDEDALVAAANVCDEDVTLSAGGTENRYECHGSFNTSAQPQDIINAMLTSMAGKAVYSGGVWRIIPGVYYTPTLTFNEGDLRDGFKVQTLLSRRESFNSIKGVFYSADDGYVATDFPSIESATYIAQDGGEKVFKDIQLQFTTSPSMAQRLAKIDLLKARQQITLTLPLKLVGLKAHVGDIVYINNARLGWASKPFEVVNAQIGFGETLGVDLSLREISTDVFGWTTSEEQPYDPAPNTNLPSAFNVGAVTDLQITATNVLAPDGATQSALLVTWTPSTNAFTAQYEVQYIRGASNFDWGSIDDNATELLNYGSVTDAPSSFADYGSIADSTTSGETNYNSIFVTQPYYVIVPAIAGVEYAVRVRAINTFGVRSDWVTTNQISYGDEGAPNAPSAFTATSAFQSITLNWINPTVSDFDSVEIYRNNINNPLTASKIAVIRASTYVDQPLNINATYFYWLKAVDRSGNKSEFSSSASATTRFIFTDDFSAEVMNLFSEAGAYGIEPVATLPATGDFDGQIKFDTTAKKLYRWDATAGVWTDDIFSIQSGSVDIASFASGIEPVGIVDELPNPSGYTGATIVFLTTDNKMYRYTGSAWTSAISTSDLTGTLEASQFSQTLRPVEVVSSLPATGNFQGRTVVLTTDNKLYRYTGTAWTAAVPTTDLSGTVSDAQIAGLAASKVTGQLTSDQIAALSTAKLTGTISETQISDGAISTAKLAAGSITTAKLAAGAVTADTIAANAITSAKIETGAITAAKIAAGSIEADKIAAGAVTAGKIAAGAITATELAADAVTAGKIAAGAISAANIQAGAIGADQIAANAITAGKIAAGAVSADQIAANAITSTKIAAGAIVADKIAAGAISTDKIAANSITGGLIAASGIITSAAQIEDAVITDAKIVNISASKIDVESLSSLSANMGTITAGLMQSGDGLFVIDLNNKQIIISV